MGRIKTKVIKRTSKEIVENNQDNVKEDYSLNKQFVSKVVDVPSKKMRNIIAGYVTRLVRNRK